MERIFNIDRPIFLIPEGHSENVIELAHGDYEMLFHDDLIQVLDYPLNLLRFAAQTFFSSEFGILWFQSEDPISIAPQGNMTIGKPCIFIQGFAGIFDSAIILQQGIKELRYNIEVPSNLFFNMTGKDFKVSIFVRAVYHDDKTEKRRFTDQSNYRAEESVMTVPVTEKLTLEYLLKAADPGHRAIDGLPGYLKLGEYDCKSGLWPCDPVAVESSKLSLGGHTYGSVMDHPDQSVKAHHLEQGILTPVGSLSSTEECSGVTFKELSDELKEARGKNNSINNRVSKIVNTDGIVISTCMDDLIYQRILDLYFRKDSEGNIIPDSYIDSESGEVIDNFEHPNPFIQEGDDRFKINPAAIADRADAVWMSVVFGSGGPGADNIIGNDSSSSPWYHDVRMPDGYSIREIFVAISFHHIQWGDAAYPFTSNIANILGCNFRLMIQKSEDNIQANCWTNMDRDGMSSWVKSGSMNVLPIGIKDYGSSYEPPHPHPPEPPASDLCSGISYAGYRKGSAIIKVIGINDPPSGDNPANGSEKGIIFSLGNTSAGSSGCAGWCNIRHRFTADGKSGWDMKQGMGMSYLYNWPDPAFCGNHTLGLAWPVYPASDGLWEVSWDADTGYVEVRSPGSTDVVQLLMYDYEYQKARFAFNTIQKGGLGGWITWVSRGSIEIMQFNGITQGNSHSCERL